MFFTVVLSAVLVMSAYVWWRAGTLPSVARRLPGWPRGVLLAVLGSSYVLARDVEGAGWPAAARVLELVGAYWIGALLLLFVAMLAGDVLSGFGLFFRGRGASIRRWSVAAGAVLVAVALVQGHRAPVVRDYDIRLGGLPAARNGTVLAFISDLHLGSLLGARWLDARVAQVMALRADLILVGGDIFEGDSPAEAAMVPSLARLSAPLGVWAVAGNHEYHGGGASTLQALERRGFRVLRNEWKEPVPGLALAGVDAGREGRHGDDSARTNPRQDAPPAPPDDPLVRALAGRPAGTATVLISHEPVRVEEAARAGVGLMVAGHTHDGQIWPFGYVVRARFPYLAGQYEVGGMPLLVCRGTGTFGPRMRLWHPGEILRITLRNR